MTLLRRQKLVTVLMTVVVVVGLGWVYTAGPPVFQARASMALVTPSGEEPPPREDTGVSTTTTTTTVNPGNPMLRWNDRSVIQDVVVRRLSSRLIRSDLRERGLTSSFDLGRSEVFYYRGPIVDIETRAASPDAAIRDAQLLIDEAGRQLDEMQTASDVPARDRIHAVTVVEPTKAVTLFASRTRRLAIALVLGVGLVFSVVAAIDGIARHRRRTIRPRRSNRPSPVSGA